MPSTPLNLNPAANPLRALLQSSDVILGGWCHLSSSFSAELVGESGVDYVVVDMQHGMAGYSDLVAMLQAIGVAGAVPLVRIPFDDQGTAQRALDAGAFGLIFPMVNNRAQAEAAVGSCRYPPLGERSFGPTRAKLHLGSDPEWSNSQVLCFVQIETREAMSNLDEILSVEGVDGVYVGPADLALSHGLAIGGHSDELDALLLQIVDVCARHGRIPGVHTVSGADCGAFSKLGYRLCSIGSDAVWLLAGYQQQVAAARDSVSSSSIGMS